ncbi:MAG: alanine--tRNA ligase [Thermoleophilia bacterium]
MAFVRTTAELRQGFLAFFEARGHLRLPSGSLVPATYDPSVLFTTAGMQPLKPYFLGLEEPPAPRITTVQKCFRTTDIDEVGSTERHLTFFEMLGNFSLGDYFKEGAQDLAYEFVTEHMGFDWDRVWVSVFAGDPELGLGEDEVAVEGWQRYLPRDRIVPLPRKDNFWQAGPTGPCGPCSELYFDRGLELGCGRPECAPGCDCPRFLEFWNLVFMEFDLGEDGTLAPLPRRSIDTGLGLERGAMLLQGVDSVFETDGYQAIMEWVASESGVRYGESERATKAHRVLADHGRAMTFLIADGVKPSNLGRGYVLRRIIRRAVQQAQRIGLADLWRLPAVVVEQMGDVYPELRQQAAEIERIVKAEEARFNETLSRGLRVFEELAGKEVVSGKDAFTLAATYGFPIELTVELAAERGQAVDVDEYSRLMEEHRRVSRAGGERGDVQRAAELARAAGFKTEFVGYEKTEVLTQIGAWEDVGEGLFLCKLRESPFYPEGGGQVTDAGFIEHEETGARAELKEAYRFEDDQVLLFQGEGFAAGDRVRAVVLWSVRFPTMANHTATHLLHRALREVLGDHVRQAGSAVRPDKLRFDFTHGQPLSAAERERVEKIVNEKVFSGLPVLAYVVPIEEARRMGAVMLFGEKYGQEVRLVEVPGFSLEACGGTHVRSTAEVGPFVIVSESSVGAGVRRIEAVTSGEAWAYLASRSRELDELRAELERLRKEARRAQAPAAEAALPEPDVKTVNGIHVIAQSLEGVDADQLLHRSDRYKQRYRPAAVVLGSREDGKVHLVANFDPQVAERISAAEVVKKAAALVGGGGGGRPTMARAGGKDASRLPQALAEAERLIVAALR